MAYLGEFGLHLPIVRAWGLMFLMAVLMFFEDETQPSASYVVNGSVDVFF